MSKPIKSVKTVKSDKKSDKKSDNKSSKSAKSKSKSVQSGSVFVETKAKGIIFHVTAPKGVNMNELAQNVKSALDAGGVVVTPENVVITTIYTK